jgi:hypothetical protein
LLTECVVGVVDAEKDEREVNMILKERDNCDELCLLTIGLVTAVEKKTKLRSKRIGDHLLISILLLWQLALLKNRLGLGNLGRLEG